MKVREESLILQNVISIEEIIPHEEWFKPVLGLRRNLVNEDIYYTSPVVFKIEKLEDEPNFGKYTYYIGLNTLVEIEEDADFKQLDFLEIGPAIWVRCAEIDELDEAYDLLEKYAKERGWELESAFYHVAFDLFDDVIMDVYAVVKGADLKSW